MLEFLGRDTYMYTQIFRYRQKDRQIDSALQIDRQIDRTTVSEPEISRTMVINRRNDVGVFRQIEGQIIDRQCTIDRQIDRQIVHYRQIGQRIIDRQCIINRQIDRQIGPLFLNYGYQQKELCRSFQIEIHIQIFKYRQKER